MRQKELLEKILIEIHSIKVAVEQALLPHTAPLLTVEKPNESQGQVIVQETLPFRKERARKHKWTPEETLDLIHMYNNELLYREIGENLGLTEEQVHYRLTKLAESQTINRRNKKQQKI